MTGQKNRFSTTEKLWDLDDKQLKTPKHDAMVLWLMDEENLGNYYELFDFPLNIDWQIYSNHRYHKVNVEFSGISIKSEHPIMSSQTFIAGYADLVITPKYSCILNENLHETNMFHLSCLIEVKPYIDSFGAVLRQVKSYEKFWRRDRTNKLMIFTLDDRFDSQFKSQGVPVLHPPKEITIEDMMDMYGLR